MNTLCTDNLTASLRGLLCACVAMAITASLTWTFTSSTTGMSWMGSQAAQPELVAAISRDRARVA